MRPATRATAGSPAWCIIRVNPVGAKAKGSADGPPSRVVEVSMCETSRSTEGRNSRSAERGPRTGQRELALGGAVRVVEHRPRRAAPGDLPQVADGVGPRETAPRRVRVGPGQAQEGPQFRRAGQPPRGADAERWLLGGRHASSFLLAVAWSSLPNDAGAARQARGDRPPVARAGAVQPTRTPPGPAEGVGEDDGRELPAAFLGRRRCRGRRRTASGPVGSRRRSSRRASRSSAS